MTLPDERTRSLVQTGAFLKELRADPTLPEAIRREADRLIRHFPGVAHIEWVATFEPAPGTGARNPLRGPANPEWWINYRFGPVTGYEL